MAYYHGVTIPSLDGRFSYYYSADRARIHENYGGNVDNVLLLISSWVTLIADSPVDPLKPKKLIASFNDELICNLFSVIRRFNDLWDKLVSNLVEDDAGRSISPFLPEFKDTPIFREYLKFYKSGDPLILRYISTFLLFGSKLYYEDPTFEQVAFRKWLEVEDRLGDLDIPDILVENVKNVIHSLFSKWVAGPLLPKHGSGRVAEPGVKGSFEKNSILQVPLVITKVFTDFGDTSEIARCIPDLAIQRLGTSSLNRSKLKFVPKNWKTARSICMEPVAYQWAQQGVRLWYESYLERELRSWIDISNQEHNQLGAQLGSEFGIVDTLDLSAASDSVSWDLVKRIFPAKVLKYLHATRTSVVDTPIGPISVRKFAPMGSALCFPVQSTIFFACLVVASEAWLRGLDPSMAVVVKETWNLNHFRAYSAKGFDPFSSKLQSVRVYGDDIICDTRITDIAIRVLRQLGFVINEEKSFVNNQLYRESCGKHYYRGSDVTPYFFKVKKISKNIPAGTFPGICEHINQALDASLTHLRSRLIKFIQYYRIHNVRQIKGKNPVLFTENDDISCSIRVREGRCCNNHLVQRKFRDVLYDCTASRYQRDEVASITVVPNEIKESDSCFDNYHYLVWQRSRYGRGKPPDILSSGGRNDTFGKRVARRWTPS